MNYSNHSLIFYPTWLQPFLHQWWVLWVRHAAFGQRRQNSPHSRHHRAGTLRHSMSVWNRLASAQGESQVDCFMWVCVMVSVGPDSQNGQKCCNILGHYERDKCQTLHDGTTHWSFLFIYHFQWPWLYFKVTGVSVTNNFNWKFDFLVQTSLECKYVKGGNWHVS